MEQSALLEQHLARGARLADRLEAPGHAAPLSFGDVPAEYEAARTRCGLLDVTDRGALVVRGADASDFLHRLLANHVKSLAPNEGNRNLLLSPKGKVLHEFELVRRAEHFDVSAPPGRAEPLRTALETFHFSEDVSLEPRTANHAPLELSGPGARTVLENALGAAPLPRREYEWSDTTWRGRELRIALLPVAGAPGFRLEVAPERVIELWECLVTSGARPCGLAARDSLRVEAGSPLYGLDIDENVYPQEAGLESAFALDKGCYVGQEVVAKIDTYGGLNKRLLVLRIDHSDPVARGTGLFDSSEGERRELGMITSWAYSFLLDTGLVLAYVKRRHQEPNTVFELASGGRATVVPPPGVRATT